MAPKWWGRSQVIRQGRLSLVRAMPPPHRQWQTVISGCVTGVRQRWRGAGSWAGGAHTRTLTCSCTPTCAHPHTHVHSQTEVGVDPLTPSRGRVSRHTSTHLRGHTLTLIERHACMIAHPPIYKGRERVCARTRTRPHGDSWVPSHTYAFTCSCAGASRRAHTLTSPRSRAEREWARSHTCTLTCPHLFPRLTSV